MAGGTGGHVFPALAVAEALRAQGREVFWIGTRQGMESRLVPEHGFEMEWIGIEGLRGKGLRAVLRGPFQLAGALWQARAHPAPPPSRRWCWAWADSPPVPAGWRPARWDCRW